MAIQLFCGLFSESIKITLINEINTSKKMHNTHYKNEYFEKTLICHGDILFIIILHEESIL